MIDADIYLLLMLVGSIALVFILDLRAW